jgi:hypothetical protein
MLARRIAIRAPRAGAGAVALRSVTRFTTPSVRNFIWRNSSQPQSPPELLRSWRDPKTGELPSVIQQWNATFMFWWNRMRYVRFLLTGAAVLGVGYVMGDAWLSRRPVTVARTLCHAFERGYVPAEAERKDTATVVARPALDKQLQRLLRPVEVDNYVLVVGAHGTGKVSHPISSITKLICVLAHPLLTSCVAARARVPLSFHPPSTVNCRA